MIGKQTKIIKVGALCWRPMVVGDSIIFATFLNFFQDLNSLLIQQYQTTNDEKYNIKYNITFFIYIKNLHIPTLFYKKYIDSGLLHITPHGYGKTMGFKNSTIANVKNLIELAKLMRKDKFDYLFNTRSNSVPFHLACFFAMAKKLFVLKTGIKKSFKKYIFFGSQKRYSSIHRCTLTVDDLNNAIINYSAFADKNILLKNKIKPRQIEISEDLLSVKQYAKPTIGFFIGASYTDKTLHPKIWAKIFDYIKKTHKDTFDIALFGFNQMEQNLKNYFEKEIQNLGYNKTSYIDFVDKNELIDDIKYCGGLSLAITNDSGFMHVASIFKIPTLSFFGYTPGNSFMTQAFNENNFIASQSSMKCSPCLTPGKCKFKIQDDIFDFRQCMMHERLDLHQKIDKAIALIKN